MVTGPRDIKALSDFYKKAEKDLVQIIKEQEAKGSLATYRKDILKGVRQELKVIDDYADYWSNNAIPKAAQTGLEMTFSEFRKANIDVRKLSVNDRTVRTLTESFLENMQTASQYVGRRISDQIREAGLEAITHKVATGSTVREAKKLLLEKLDQKGITAIRDSRGREIKMDVYAKMVARTTTREATNRSAIDAVLNVGEDLVQCTTLNTTCPVCSVYQGRVYSISGNNKDYPPLEIVPGFKDGYSTIHPNCGHNMVPYFPRYDDEAEETKKFSNRPFEPDKKAEKKVKSYADVQKKNAERAKDRKEWEQLKKEMGGNQVPTFSAFRSMKKANSQKYLELLAKQAALKDKLKQAALKASPRAKITLDKFKSRTGVPQAYVDQLMKKLDDAPEDCRKFFARYEDRIVLNDIDWRYTPQYRVAFRDINYNLAEDAVDTAVHKANETIMHETAHLFDGARQAESKGILPVWSKSGNGELDRLIKEEANDYIMGKRNALGAATGGKVTPQKLKYEVYMELSNGGQGDIAYSSVSDIMQQATHDGYSGAFGHKPGYWKTHDPSVEAFAEFYAATVVTKEELPVIMKYFPKSYDYFLEIMKGAGSVYP